MQDAELDGARWRAGREHRAPPGHGGCGGGAVLFCRGGAGCRRGGRAGGRPPPAGRLPRPRRPGCWPAVMLAAAARSWRNRPAKPPRPDRPDRCAAGPVGWLARGSAAPGGPARRANEQQMRRIRCMAMPFDVWVRGRSDAVVLGAAGGPGPMSKVACSAKRAGLWPGASGAGPPSREGHGLLVGPAPGAGWPAPGSRRRPGNSGRPRQIPAAAALRGARRR
jgi:hypothetical protein